MATNIRQLEERAQEAILRYSIENYKQRNENWFNKPAVRKALFTYSFFRTGNAIFIAAMILLTGCMPLVALPLMGVTSTIALLIGALVPLVLGIIGELAFLYLSMSSDKIQAKAVRELLSDDMHFRPAKIDDKGLERQVEKALEYWAQIDEAIERVPEGVLKDRMLNTAQEVTHWLKAVYELADRVDEFRKNRIVGRDLEAVPEAIEKNRRRLKREDNPAVKAQLERTIADQERQLAALQKLQSQMEQATYQLDSTISSLGTIYSQLLLVGDKDQAGGNIDRLQSEISEQVYQLEDLTEAMDEVYSSSSY